MKTSTTTILIIVQLVIFVGLLVFVLRGQQGLSFITQLFTQTGIEEQAPVQIQPSQVPAQNSASGEVAFDTFGVEKVLIDVIYITSDKTQRTLSVKSDNGTVFDFILTDDTYVGKAVVKQNPQAGVLTSETSEEVIQNVLYDLPATTKLKILYHKSENKSLNIAEDVRIYY